MWTRRRPPPPPPPAAPPSGPDLVDGWCAAQTFYWEHAYTGPRDFTDAFRMMNEATSTVFLFDFDHDRVALRPKPAAPWSGHKRVEYDYGVGRAALYLDLFRGLVADGLRLTAPVAMETHDVALYGDEAPVFCHQKLASARKMLLPDIDFIHHQWYAADLPEPAWSDKRPVAGFAGSSTGGDVLTRRDVEGATSQRLRWALSALGRPAVEFHICDAVQCDGADTVELLRSQPYFRPRISWEAQLACRYLISVDGNGATCSRIVNTLRSGSVLFKSDSPHRLYYFDGLRPYEHYVPVNDLNEVERAVDDLEGGRLSHAAIIGAANRFFREHLTRPAVLDYTRRLLERYAARVLRRA